MKKTLLATIDFSPRKGGVAKYYEDICGNLSPDKIVALASHEIGEEEFDELQKYKIYRKNLISKFPIWPKWILSFFYLRKVIKKENIDIILVGQILPIGAVAYIYKKLFKMPYAVFIHGMDIEMAKRHPRKKRLAKKILENAKFIIANSEYTKGLVIEQGIEESKIKVVYPCVDTRICADKNTNQHEFKNISKKCTLLTVGRLVKRKGHDMVIKALPKVIEAFPNIKYIIGGDGPDRNYIEGIVKECGMGRLVEFLGRISDEEKFKLMRECDIFITPSRNIDGDVEGFGIVYLEAALFGKPVIAGHSGGAIEAVLDGETGILVNPENYEEIADAIIKLLSDPVLANKLGVQGKERVFREFGLDAQIEKIKRLLL